MIASAEWTGEGLFAGKTESGHTVVFDTGKDHAQGPSPMEAVLTALCACTSVDVVGILAKKRQKLTALRVTATAEQASAAPRVFTEIALQYEATGEGLELKAVEDAVALSKQKYCSVSIMLQEAVKITATVVVTESAGGVRE